MKNRVIGIDLHGTLLDESWQVKDKLANELIVALYNKSAYVCTGNDIRFVYDYVQTGLLKHFSGFVLETGCVVSENKGSECIVSSPEQIKKIKELEMLLRNAEFPEVLYFGRRLATISLFTLDEHGRGKKPDEFYMKCQEFVGKNGYLDDVCVTHSSVAVDIIPRGHNKFTGMKRITRGREIIGIADSYNDFHLINDADYGFIPCNASPRLIDALRAERKEIVSIDTATGLKEGQVVQSNKESTEFVIEALKFLDKV